jgi:hypothetical protein
VGIRIRADAAKVSMEEIEAEMYKAVPSSFEWTWDLY